MPYTQPSGRKAVKTITGFTPDIHIKGEYFHPETSKRRKREFLVEIERKDEPTATYREKWPLYKSLTKEVLENNKISQRVEFCIVYSTNNY